MKAVCTQKSNKQSRHESIQQTGEFESFGHRKNSRSQSALEQVNQSFTIAGKLFELVVESYKRLLLTKFHVEALDEDVDRNRPHRLDFLVQ